MRGFSGPFVAVEEKVAITVLKIFPRRIYMDAKGLISKIL
jgi:hypothetical protein